MLAKRSIGGDSILAKRERLREIIYENSLLKDREFVLASGAHSNYYFDMKPTTHDPEGASLVGDVLLDYLSQYDFKFLGGLAAGAIPLVIAVCIRSWPDRPIRGFFVRDEAKDHGTKKLIDGFIEDGASVIIVDDVTTLGGSAMKAVRAVRSRGCSIVRVVSLVDRLEGATESFAREGIEFQSIFTRDDFR